MVKIPYFGWEIPEFILVIIGTIIGALIGGYCTIHSTHDVYEEEQNTIKQNVALALFIDISDISDRFNITVDQYNDIVADTKKMGILEPPIVIDQRPYYSTNGLYYIYANEIYKFDGNLSRDLFKYYKNVMNIEYERQFVYDHKLKEATGGNLSQMEKDYMYKYSEAMPIEMNQSIKNGEKIKTQLDKEYNLHLYIPPNYKIYYNYTSYN
jgi:hypothetical protein